MQIRRIKLPKDVGNTGTENAISVLPLVRPRWGGVTSLVEIWIEGMASGLGGATYTGLVVSKVFVVCYEPEWL